MASTTATSADLPRRPPALDLRQVRRVAWLLAAGLFEVAIGAGVASSHHKYAIGLVAAVAVCWLIWSFPLAGCGVYMFLAAGIVDSGQYIFHAGGRTLYGDEVVLAVLLLRAILRPRRKTWGGPAGAALAAFLAIFLFSTALAVEAHTTSLNNAVTWGRVFFVMTYFWVVVRLAPDRRRLGILLAAGIMLGVLSGIVGLAVALSGDANTIFQSSGNMVNAPGTSFLRVRMPGLGLGFMLLWVLVVWLIRNRRPHRLWIICLPWVLIVILISQNRNMWVVDAFSLVLVMLIAGPRVRGRLIISLVALVAAIAVLIVVPLGGSTAPSPLTPIVARASTLLNPRAVQASSSASDRDYEDQQGWATAKRNLAIGIGPGVSYGATIGTGSGDTVSYTARLFLQNQYLYLLVITGIPGVVAWILFLLTTIRNAFIVGVPIESKMLGIGVFGLSLTAIVMLSFTDASYLTALSLCAGAIFALRPAAAQLPQVGPQLPQVGLAHAAASPV